MCGIAGFIDPSRQLSELSLRETVTRMTETLHHRGPDDTGVLVEASLGTALGHKRLSIVDLSPHGHQPMVSACERFSLVYNGEIYNHRELRSDLESAGHKFRGHADTEVLLAAVAAWGVEATLSKLNGMFAFALFDRKARRLTLVRDRLGIKPLYYGWVGKSFAFSSELKALKTVPGFSATVDRNSLQLFLRNNYVPGPKSIYENVYKLQPGTKLSVELDGERRPKPKPYWSLFDAVENRTIASFAGTAQDAIAELDQRILKSVKNRMVADVPLGAFLSGGIDSSAVVAAMQNQSDRPVQTFSIGFEEKNYDESPFARQVAQHLGTEHHEWIVKPAEARDVIPKLPTIYDEPFADSSQIPTYLVSQLARQHVTVSLSGDGGDELFGGYQRYQYMQQLWRKIGFAPSSVRSFGAAAIRSVFRNRYQSVLARKANTLADFMSLSDFQLMYSALNTHWKNPAEIVVGAEELPNIGPILPADLSRSSSTEVMMFLDTLNYLPDDILTKVDRASMAVSLEARVPLLDHEVVEFAWSLPFEFKSLPNEPKWLLKQVLKKYVPLEMFDRPKVGFGVPIDSWLRGPLRDWAESLLDGSRLTNEGYFHPQPIREKWNQHLAGQQDWHYYLWDILMFQAWLEAE